MSNAPEAGAAALVTTPNFTEPGRRDFWPYTAGDDFYELLIDTHRGLSDEQSQLVNSKLVLLLANHVGDLPVLREALGAARAGVVEAAAAADPAQA